jgi:hypothetical protein
LEVEQEVTTKTVPQSITANRANFIDGKFAVKNAFFSTSIFGDGDVVWKSWIAPIRNGRVFSKKINNLFFPGNGLKSIKKS